MRYLPLNEADRQEMLGAIGANGIDDLFCDVPKEALLREPVDLPPHQGEIEVGREMQRMAARNRAAGQGPFFLG
ncbi:MAG: glycine dehydrogenase, partial [Alphaproteobacteria bacterium]|nr:glycine dehydrogenase [Alphaproteobacteria bacterium]